MLGLYLALHLIFATLYILQPGDIANAHPYSFGDAFFFSFETLATVGYGEYYPVTTYGRAVACAEIVCGVASTAILTGLIFARFARPRAKFVLADAVVVAQHNEKPTLMARVGNGRTSVLSDAYAKISVLLTEITPEGRRIRFAQELKLERSHLPVFPLTWTLMHIIDEASPIHGFDQEHFLSTDARLFLSLEARDPVLSAVVHEIRTYPPRCVRFGWRYADAIFEDDDGSPIADFTRISAIEPDRGPEEPESGWSDKEAV